MMCAGCGGAIGPRAGFGRTPDDRVWCVECSRYQPDLGVGFALIVPLGVIHKETISDGGATLELGEVNYGAPTPDQARGVLVCSECTAPLALVDAEICVDCKIDDGVSVHLHPSTVCRDKHEARRHPEASGYPGTVKP